MVGTGGSDLGRGLGYDGQRCFRLVSNRTRKKKEKEALKRRGDERDGYGTDE